MPEALAYLRKQGASASGDPLLALYLGEALRRSGKPLDAEAAYRRAAALDPKEGRAFLGLAYLAESRGDVPEAINLYARALAVTPGLGEAQTALSRMLQGMPVAP